MVRAGSPGSGAAEDQALDRPWIRDDGRGQEAEKPLNFWPALRRQSQRRKTFVEPTKAVELTYCNDLILRMLQR